MTYEEYISQFEILENPPIKEGFHRHHIVPRSQQTEVDERCVYLTPAQHLWAHILYDRENGADTAHFLVTQSKITHEIHSYEDCLPFNATDLINREINSKSNTGCNHPMYGKHHTEEAKRRMSDYQKGRVVSDETRKKMSEASKGRKKSEETKKKLRESHLGKKVSDETKKKLSEHNKWKGTLGPMYGQHHSEETKRKISESRRGKEAYWLKGKELSDEHKKKISDKLKSIHSGENNPAYGRHWYTNGEVNFYGFECPEGYRPGMTRTRKSA